MLCSILSLRAQTFVKPAVKVKDTSFAVITNINLPGTILSRLAFHIILKS